MATTNQERVGKAMDLFRQGIAPFVEREVQSSVSAGTVHMDRLRRFVDDPMLRNKPINRWDVAGLLKLMWETWNEVFARTLGRAERSLVQELRDWRNKWAHQEPFSSRDAERALDSMVRLLSAVSAPEADEVDRMMLELRRLTIDEQVRGEKRKAGGSLIQASTTGTLKPWREIVTPHPDVASGQYQQAEFAAALWQVHLGEGSDEYKKPYEFFRRTFLTENLTRLLVGAVERLSGKGGDPVVQLQTNFGGGKTHSMLALYHLFSGKIPGELPGADTVMSAAGVTDIPATRRVVLVGNKISPGNPTTKPDGTVVRTLWGELAWQIGGKNAFERIAKDDENSTSPGDVLRELMIEYGPCLILIDEWVAYARQLHDQSDLPAGSFETQFTFTQALTESARLANNCLLVISLPASDTSGSPHTQADDVEVGGIRGREALDRLRNVVGRVESSWRPASAEESFEIVRRRLFESPTGEEAFKQRDVTARAFADQYRAQTGEFPPECRSTDYEKRIQAAFPIHPEIFDRLYEDWSTLVKFQRTRGVLRLMAAVIHSLWEKGDRNPLILPSTIPIDDERVKNELTRYLSDNWLPIIEKDVDGSNSLPMKIDGEVPTLGKLHATRRVARTIYLGSAPTTQAAHRGLEDRRVKLGCVAPGESPAVFGDALRRLAASATYLYQDGSRAWYATQPTVTKLAEDRSEQLKRDSEKVTSELDTRVRADLRRSGDFSGVHPLPRTGADVPDDLEARLVVLPSDHPYSRGEGNAAENAAQLILEFRGNTPRLYRNTLVFLAADKTRLQDLEDALSRYLAWTSILDEKEILDLSPFQVRQAETQKQAADSAVTARLPETYQWALVPEQKTPQTGIEWHAIRLTGADALAVRVSRKLRSEELLITTLGSTIMRKYLDEVPLWRGDHVSVRQLVEDFAQLLYLPRLVGPDVLTQTMRDGVALLTWQTETFGYAEYFSEEEGRYGGLRGGQLVMIIADDAGLLVNPDTACRQLESEVPPAPDQPDDDQTPGESPDSNGTEDPDTTPPSREKLSRFYGTARLDPTRVGRDAGQIAEAVIAHLSGQPGAEVTVTIEIEARLPDGASEHTVRTVSENSDTLRFTNHGFEAE
ncbi:MAG: ATP-binding protein [Gemmatimonadetes bacterium]|nr:ATP-binding protein [Gemmatimonadota bacterium]